MGQNKTVQRAKFGKRYLSQYSEQLGIIQKKTQHRSKHTSNEDIYTRLWLDLIRSECVVFVPWMDQQSCVLLAFYFYFLELSCPNGIFPMGNSGSLPCGKPTATESRYPTYGAYWVFEYFHNSPNSDTDYGIFNVHTDVNACDCTRRCTDTVRESAPKLDSGDKDPVLHRRIEPASAACRPML